MHSPEDKNLQDLTSFTANDFNPYPQIFGTVSDRARFLEQNLDIIWAILYSLYNMAHIISVIQNKLCYEDEIFCRMKNLDQIQHRQK